MRDSVKSPKTEKGLRGGLGKGKGGGGGGGGGGGEGERETFFKKVSLSPPPHSALYGN